MGGSDTGSDKKPVISVFRLLFKIDLEIDRHTFLWCFGPLSVPIKSNRLPIFRFLWDNGQTVADRPLV